MAGICYSIKKNRLNAAYKNGFLVDGDALYADKDAHFHEAFLPALDSAADGTKWGRLFFCLEAKESQVVYLYAAASDSGQLWVEEENKYRSIESYLLDQSVPSGKKFAALLSAGGKRFVNRDDILLYELSGRYLYLAIEAVESSETKISRMRAEVNGNTFLSTFPEAYQQWDSFFHRFLSIYASIFEDMQDEVENLPDLLDVEKCPKEMLPVYAGWLGIDIGDSFFEEEVQRNIVREAAQLNRMKGSRWALGRILELALGETPIILEQNTVRSYEEREGIKDFLPESRFDVSILIRHTLTETLRFRLMHLLEQFVPIRTKIRIFQLTESGILDENSYMDLNARVYAPEEASLDYGQALDGTITLSE